MTAGFIFGTGLFFVAASAALAFMAFLWDVTQRGTFGRVIVIVACEGIVMTFVGAALLILRGGA